MQRGVWHAWRAGQHSGRQQPPLPGALPAAQPCQLLQQTQLNPGFLWPPCCCRGLTVRTRASHSHSATADLAVYQFAQRHAGTAAPWFQAAVRDIVKQVDQAPFLQTVQLDGDASGERSPRFSTFNVHDSVVSVPEVRLCLPACLSACLPLL